MAFMKKYASYTVGDFVADDGFVRWVKNINPDNQYWESVELAYPEKKPLMDEARKIVLLIDFNDELSAPEKQLLWHQIQQNIKPEVFAKVVELKPFKKTILVRRMMRLAVAMFFLVAVSGTAYLLFFKLPKDVTVSTEYGEIEKVLLSDGSVITLNAHSTIRYASAWDSVHKREIWLDGEAYFSVQHKKNNQPFIVHASEMDVEVLGTEFNVFKREGKVNVSLNSGKIKLTLPGENTEPLMMKPGDLVELSTIKSKLVKKTVNVAKYSAWKENKLYFDDTSLEEIIQMMQATYGWEVSVADNDLLDEKISGEINTKNELEFLNALATALDIDIEKSGNKITIKKN
jgi:transmembrane sensor